MAVRLKWWHSAVALALTGCSAPVASPGAASGPGAAPKAVVAKEARPGNDPAGEQVAQASPTKGTVPSTTGKGPGFSFGSDAGGKLLAEKLVPQPAATPLPYVERPQPARVLEMERAGTAGTWLAPLELLAPRGLMPPAAEGKSRALVDVPMLAHSTEGAMPALPQMPMTARAYAAAPDPERVPALPPLARPVSAPPVAASDPTAEASLAVLLAPGSGGRATPAPPIPLEIPDPFKLVRSMELRAAPAEASPAYSSTAAPRPMLPVEPAKPAETKSGGG